MGGLLPAQAGTTSPRREAQPRQKSPSPHRRPIPDGMPSAQTEGPSPDGSFLRPARIPSAETGASVTECATDHEYFSDKKCLNEEMNGRSNEEKLSLSISGKGEFDNATSITIINNDKFG